MAKFLKPLQIFLIGLVAVCSFFLLERSRTEAANNPNILTGYAWSSNIGWISFKGDNYQVTVDPTTGEFGGYAWSSNIGWIRFDPSGPYPASPDKFATVETVTTPSGQRNQVQGWIRACTAAADPIACSGTADPLSGNTGGWDGWIKMSGNTTNCPPMANPSTGPYETCLTLNGTDMEGWAWGGDVVGWIQFDPDTNGISIPPGSIKIKEIRPR